MCRSLNRIGCCEEYRLVCVISIYKFFQRIEYSIDNMGTLKYNLSDLRGNRTKCRMHTATIINMNDYQHTWCAFYFRESTEWDHIRYHHQCSDCFPHVDHNFINAYGLFDYVCSMKVAKYFFNIGNVKTNC